MDECGLRHAVRTGWMKADSSMLSVQLDELSREQIQFKKV